MANIIVDQSLKDSVFSKEAGRICYTIIQVRSCVCSVKHLGCYVACPWVGIGRALPHSRALTPCPSLLSCHLPHAVAASRRALGQHRQPVPSFLPLGITGGYLCGTASPCPSGPISSLHPVLFLWAYRQRANKLARASSGGAC